MAPTRKRPNPPSAEQGSEGADGNARLTGEVGLLLLFVLFVEGLTILRVRNLIALHIVVGLVLIPPALLKLASTGYRLVRYYTHSPSYVRRGPPPPLLRWTAPLLIIFTGAVLASGVALLTVAPQASGLILSAHKLSFIIWFAWMALHVLGHLTDAVVLSRLDWRPRAHGADPDQKGHRPNLTRPGLVLVSLVAGLALAAALLPLAAPWTSQPIRDSGAEQVGHSTLSAGRSSWP